MRPDFINLQPAVFQPFLLNVLNLFPQITPDFTHIILEIYVDIEIDPPTEAEALNYIDQFIHHPSVEVRLRHIYLTSHACMKITLSVGVTHSRVEYDDGSLVKRYADRM